MTISVVIPSVRPTTIASAVSAIRRQSMSDWELIVVGQGEDCGLEAEVARVGGGDQRVRHIHVDRRGLSLARNVGVAAAAGGVVAFTDDDCEAAPDWLEVLASAFRADPAIGLVGGAVLRPSTGKEGWLTTCPTNVPAEIRYDPAGPARARPRGWDWIGANFAVRRSVLSEVGPFDEALGAGARYPSAEDVDYKYRLERRGVVMLSTPRAVVHHTYGVRSGVKAGLRHSRNYARGNAAMAAKLTLQGDPFGAEWRKEALWGTPETRRQDLKPHRIPVALLRRWHFFRAYDEVVTRGVVDAEQLDVALATRWAPRALSR